MVTAAVGILHACVVLPSHHLISYLEPKELSFFRGRKKLKNSGASLLNNMIHMGAQLPRKKKLPGAS
jgi:hypothetical protein